MRSLFICFVILISTGICAQRVIDVTKDDANLLNPNFFYTVSGQPVGLPKYVKVVEGSAFFNPEWLNGRVMLSEGKEYGPMQLKLDLLKDELYYLDPSGREMIATTPLQRIILIDTIKNLHYIFINSFAIPAKNPDVESGWYELMNNGKASIYKKLTKVITETKPYGSATTEQIIHTSSKYFILFNNQLIRIKKFKDLADMLSDKKSEVQTFIKTNKLTGKNDEDYNMVVSYYNDMFQ
jgi:hypothetical protein